MQTSAQQIARLKALVSVSNVASVPDSPQSARRLVDISSSRSALLTTNAVTGEKR